MLWVSLPALLCSAGACIVFRDVMGRAETAGGRSSQPVLSSSGYVDSSIHYTALFISISFCTVILVFLTILCYFW